MYARRLNSNKVSEMTGIRYSSVRDMEKNQSNPGALKNLNKIMEALKIEDISDLIEYVKTEECTNENQKTPTNYK